MGHWRSRTTSQACGSQSCFRQIAALDSPRHAATLCGTNRGKHMLNCARLVVAACATFVVAAAGEARAQAWPTHPVRMIVPFPTGGSADTLARLLGNKVTEGL